MDLKMNCLPLLKMWFEVDGEVFFLACWLYLAHSLVRNWLRLRMSSKKNQKASKSYLVHICLSHFVCVWCSPVTSGWMWNLDWPSGSYWWSRASFSWWFRLLFGILEAPALHSVTAHHYYFHQDDWPIFPKKIKMQVFLLSFINSPW